MSDESGRLVSVTGDARDDLVRRVLEIDEPIAGGRVRYAVQLFRSRDATVLDKHRATRALVDVLERRRELLKHALLSRDEGALFTIANPFEIRHLDARQNGGYESVFLG